MEPDVWQNFIPSPILAVVLLYQVNKDKDMLYPDNVYYLPKDDVSAQPFFLRQTIGNACGTVALLHALCNNEDKCNKGFVRNSFLDTFCTKMSRTPPPWRGPTFSMKMSWSRKITSMCGVLRGETGF
jgi:ubiquitin carboxyl-terminal hydrolase L3